MPGLVPLQPYLYASAFLLQSQHYRAVVFIPAPAHSLGVQVAADLGQGHLDFVGFGQLFPQAQVFMSGFQSETGLEIALEKGSGQPPS